MKEWIVLQGWPLYLMLGMTGLGLLGSILSRIFYGRLAREAQLCGTSDYPMLHYIRQKYSSYYKLGMRPGNTELNQSDCFVKISYSGNMVMK